MEIEKLNGLTSLSQKMVSIVVPVFNEEEGVSIFHDELMAVVRALPCRHQIIYVNDGSRDKTPLILQEICDHNPEITLINLSRNFGHQAALTAGMDLADGDYVITMDGDGQHPPILIPEMLFLAENGYEVVITQREDAKGSHGFKKFTSESFYRWINRIGQIKIIPGGADFRLLSKTALQSIKGMREYQRFLRGMVSWIGFKSITLPYTPPQRIAGTTKYTLRKMLSLAASAIFSFSLVPIYASITIGAIFLFLALCEMIFVLSFWFSGRIENLAPGWSSLMFIILIVGGCVMISLGIIGIYIGFIFQEVKGRPIYIVQSQYRHAEDPTLK